MQVINNAFSTTLACLPPFRRNVPIPRAPAISTGAVRPIICAPFKHGAEQSRRRTNDGYAQTIMDKEAAKQKVSPDPAIGRYFILSTC